MRNKLLLIAALFIWFNPARANDDYFDLYYVPSSELEFVLNGASTSESGEGYGAKARIVPGEHRGILFNAEYQTAGEYQFGPFSSTDVKQVRAGLGALFGGRKVHGGFYVEYIQLMLDNNVNGEFDIDGPGVQGLVIFHPGKPITLSAQIGLQFLQGDKSASANNDLIGSELTLGFGYNPGGGARVLCGRPLHVVIG